MGHHEESKRTALKWEKIFSNHLSYERLVSQDINSKETSQYKNGQKVLIGISQKIYKWPITT